MKNANSASDALVLEAESEEVEEGEEEEEEEEEVEEEVEEEDTIKTRAQHIENARKQANVGQEKQAAKMLNLNKKIILNVKVNDLVLLSVPDVDRGPLDPSNLLCYVIEEKHSLFKLGTRAGVLDKFFAFNAFQKTELVTDFSLSDIPKVEKKDKNQKVIGSEYKIVGVREAIKVLSVGNGQEFLKCSCQGQCATRRCSYRWAKI